MIPDLSGRICFDDVRGMHVLVALSGGADSVALLHLLHERRQALGLRITAAHFHHGIRGCDADADAEFCRELCAGLNIKLIEGSGDIPALARQFSQGMETAARNARYSFLRNIQQQCGAHCIALAHHMDDQAETILMHLLRGAGPEGICGMERLQDGLYRPLLNVPKRNLVEYLQENGISWREDATNRISDNPRNALRLNVLPEIEKSYPAAAQAIVRYGALARDESGYIARAADAFLEQRLDTGPYGMRIRLDGNEDTVILRRAVRRVAGTSLSMEKTEEIVALCGKTRGKADISAALRAEKTPLALYFLRKDAESIPEVKLNIPGITLLPGICRILAEIGNFPMNPQDPMTENFDADHLHGAIVRTRREGDRIHPLGAPGSRLLSDYLTDKKIDQPLRNVLPLVARDQSIIWAGGAGISHEARITPNTRRMVRLSIQPITDEKPEG